MNEHVTPESSKANNDSRNEMPLSTECFEEAETPAIRQYCVLGYTTTHTNKTINQDKQVQQQHQPLIPPPNPPTPLLTAPEQPNPEPTPAPVTPIDHQPLPIPRSKGSYHNIIIELDRLR